MTKRRIATNSCLWTTSDVDSWCSLHVSQHINMFPYVRAHVGTAVLHWEYNPPPPNPTACKLHTCAIYNAFVGFNEPIVCHIGGLSTAACFQSPEVKLLGRVSVREPRLKFHQLVIIQITQPHWNGALLGILSCCSIHIFMYMSNGGFKKALLIQCFCF